jgi:hypothetical protein
VGTVSGAVDSHFAFGSTTNRADVFSPCRAKPFHLAMFANRTGQLLLLALDCAQSTCAQA